MECPNCKGSGREFRIYPKMHPWTQKNARWSTVDPPIAQLPKVVRPMLVPDPGWPWLVFDWKNIELRIIAYVANDEPLIHMLENNEDAHTVHMCQFFDYPMPADLTNPGADKAWAEAIRWQGGADIRRTFTKRLIFRLCYGGDPELAHTVPGANKLMSEGITKGSLIEGSHRWLGKHPALVTYWDKLIEDLKTGTLRTALGRRRTFLATNWKKRIREGKDFPMQATVSDIKNWLVAQLYKRRDIVRFVKEMHDSVTTAIREDAWDEGEAYVRGLALRPWIINGREVVFPADFEPRRDAE